MRAHSLIWPRRVGWTRCGIALHCDLRDFIQRRIYFFKVFEHHLTALFESTIRPGDVVLDIGANIGYFTTLAAKLTGPSGRVIAIEADPHTFAALQRNVD